MSRFFYIVTPCGGTPSEAQTTVDSVLKLAATQPATTFVHILVFNNGLTAAVDYDAAPSNYQAIVRDLGEVGSRARARNTGLDLIAERPAGLVCFLDAGDRALASDAIDTAFNEWSAPTERAFWAFAAFIVGDDIRSVRRPRPLWLRRINNPFLIGATYTTSPLAISSRFSEGAKEDWKYWLALIDTSPKISLRDDVVYEYQVVSTTDHLRRKKGLVREQYRFFSEHLGYGHGVRTSLSMIAHLTIATTAWLRRSTRLRPKSLRP